MKTIKVLMCFLLLCLAGCQAKETHVVNVVLEQREGYEAESYAIQALRHEDIAFRLTESEGYRIVSCDYENAKLTRTNECLWLELPDVKYNERIHLKLHEATRTMTYEDGMGQHIVMPVLDTHERVNTEIDLFENSGHTQIGWRTEDGVLVGLGSRTEANKTLYAEWMEWTDERFFSFEEIKGQRVIAHCSYEGDTVVVPGNVDGIKANAFAHSKVKTVVLPKGLVFIEGNAFVDSSLETLYVFDDIVSVSDYAFRGSRLKTLHINAVESPVYSKTYYATFADKMDRLMHMKDDKKIVLFSGSSTRFGYDSAMIDDAFEGYGVVNMGVFAYTNALPQMEMIRCFMNEGDILVHSPEFDAAQRQFCTTTKLDAPFFNMLEANYDLLSLLDLRQYGNVFTAFHGYLVDKETMEADRYETTPSDYDENGNPVPSPSYNAYGDYVAYRENASNSLPVYGLEVNYTKDALGYETFVKYLNAEYQKFLAMGIQVYFTYAPRNRLALSTESTQEAILALDNHLRETLVVPVISNIFDSLVDGRYLYGTDNHLTTQGVEIRTKMIIEELKGAMDG